MGLTKQVDVEFECKYSRGSTRCTAHEVSYQRNGISGEGFNVVRFTLHSPPEEYGELELLGVVFSASKHVAVIDFANLDSHWRGDNFEAGLREVVRAWEKLL